MTYSTDALFRSAYQTAKHHIIPFIEKVKPIRPGMHILDIGCGEGGVLKAFAEKECNGIGIDLMEKRIKDARQILKDEPRLHFKAVNVYDFTPEEKFDIIILKDAIEHIPEKTRLLRRLKDLLQPDGIIWLGFPPFPMPLGGHQQIIPNNKLLRFLPYYHLLPTAIYRKVLEMGGVSPRIIELLLEIKELGLSIEDFHRFARQAGYRIAAAQHFFLNPSYQYRFGLPTLRSFFPFNKIPYLRNFYTMGVYYIIQPKS